MRPSRSQALMLMPALALILALLPTVYVDAFRSSATAGPPDVVPMNLPTKRTSQLPQTHPNGTRIKDSSNKTIENPTETRARQFKYDLGIGKNKPVTNGRVAKSSTAESPIDPTRFLTEYEAVSTYPSPLNLNPIHQAKSNKKNLPKVNHKRHSEDVLEIRDTNDDDGHRNDDDGHRNDDISCHPVIIPIHNYSSKSKTTATQLDVNTVWVEMMLHNERSKVLAH